MGLNDKQHLYLREINLAALQSGEFFLQSSKMPGTFFPKQRNRARVCSLCEVICYAIKKRGDHLDFFVHGFPPQPHEETARLYTKPLMF